MEIETMKELKDVLNKIPDNVLDNFVVGQNEGECGIVLGCTEGELETDMMDNFNKYVKAHPELKLLRKYFNAIGIEALNEESNLEPVRAEE